MTAHLVLNDVGNAAYAEFLHERNASIVDFGSDLGGGRAVVQSLGWQVVTHRGWEAIDALLMSEQWSRRRYWGLKPQFFAATPYVLSRFLRRELLPRTLVLTHLHKDHYNGLLYSQRNELKLPFMSNLHHLYTPAIPRIGPTTEGSIFAMRLAVAFEVISRTVSQWGVGADGDLMELDIQRLIRELADSRPEHRILQQGDRIRLGPYSARVIWPPRQVNGIDHAVSRAIEAFGRAISRTPYAQMYERLLEPIGRQLHSSESGDQEVSPESGIGSLEEGEDQESIDMEEGIEYEGEEGVWAEPTLPQPLKQANLALKGIANDLSLVMAIPGRVLWLGDASRRALPSIIAYLMRERMTSFEYVVASHHGTTWHDHLKVLDPTYVVISNGDKHSKNLKPGYRELGDAWYSTYRDGTIVRRLT